MPISKFVSLIIIYLLIVVNSYYKSRIPVTTTKNITDKLLFSALHFRAEITRISNDWFSVFAIRSAVRAVRRYTNKFRYQHYSMPPFTSAFFRFASPIEVRLLNSQSNELSRRFYTVPPPWSSSFTLKIGTFL